MAALTPPLLARARRDYFAYNLLNSISFAIVSGNLLTLLALKLGASNLYIGLLSSLGYASYFFMALGKRLVRKYSIVGVSSWGWLLRYLAFIPVLIAPFLALAGQAQLGLSFILLSFLGFNAARGVGMIGTNPILANLAEGSEGGRDRGSFLSGVTVTAAVANLLTTMVLVVLLRLSENLAFYAVLLGTGVALGAAGCWWMFRLPEPHDFRPPPGIGLFRVLAEAWKESPYRRFLVVYTFLAFVASMGRAFLPVYAKDAWGLTDDLVMLFSFTAGLGNVAMGLLQKRVVDRLGPKPLYIIFTVIGLAGLLPMVLLVPHSPLFAAPWAPVALLAGIFLVSSFGLNGSDAAAQTYHFALVPKERTLDLAIVYFVAYAVGGTAGAASGGLLLDGLKAAGLAVGFSYQVFYGVVVVLLLVSLPGLGRLVRQGAATVRESLASLFSARDLRAFDLLSRLDRSDDPDEEIKLIREIGETGVVRSQAALVEHLASPRIEVRLEALLALENLEQLAPETLLALEREVERRPLTTAWVAARILGLRGDRNAVSLLRSCLDSDDDLLAGAALVALARLGDHELLPRFEAELKRHGTGAGGNLRLTLAAAYAVEIGGQVSSVPALLEPLVAGNLPDWAADELVLALARLTGVLDRFYPAYSAFLEDEARGRVLVREGGRPAARVAAASPWLNALAGRELGRGLAFFVEAWQAWSPAQEVT
ncbi:MAG: MFS transporter [Spirochaetales bacterium]